MSDCSTHAFDVPLKPCPFCGGEAETFNPFDNADGTWCILCSECAAATGFEQTEAEAIAAWNSRAPIEYDGWFYLPKPKEGIVVYGEPEITRTENGYKVRRIADVVDEAARKWGEELGEYVMRRICEVWNSRAERMCRDVSMDSSTQFYCSECECTVEVPLLWGEINYCPNCGSKVVGE